MKKRNFIWIIILAVGVIAALSVALQPKVLPVESARVTSGPLEQAIEAEGKTRVLARFIVAAPVTGRMARIKLRRGDIVERQSVITTIEPLPLTPLDARQYAEANARISSAQSVQREAQALVESMRVECDQARRERERLEKLIETGDASFKGRPFGRPSM